MNDVPSTWAIVWAFGLYVLVFFILVELCVSRFFEKLFDVDDFLIIGLHRRVGVGALSLSNYSCLHVVGFRVVGFRIVGFRIVRFRGKDSLAGIRGLARSIIGVGINFCICVEHVLAHSNRKRAARENPRSKMKMMVIKMTKVTKTTIE